MIETNFYICGLAPYENELLILTYFKETEDSDEDEVFLRELINQKYFFTFIKIKRKKIESPFCVL